MKWERTAWLSAAIALVALAIWTPPATACAPGKEVNQLVVDPVETGLDTLPPSNVVIEEVLVERGEDTAGTLCISLGSVGLRLGAPKDDRTPAEALGYVLGSPEEESLAPFFDSDAMPFLAEGGVVWFNFADNRENPLKLTLRLAAVDLAGNQGTWSDDVEVTHPGIGEAGGCVTDGSTGASSLFLLLAIALPVVIRPRTEQKPQAGTRCHRNS